MKGSFILYQEMQEVFEALTDEQAGRLIKTIFEYCNTQDKKTLKIDDDLKLVFIPIRQQLDRNEQKYEEKSEKRRLAGSKGGKQKVANLANATFATKNLANVADNDNDNDNVNDNDNIFPPISPQGGKEQKEDIFINPVIENFSREYQKVFSTRPPLMQNHREKILELNRELEDFKETIPEVLGALKTLNFPEVGFKPNIMWLLKDDNYIKVKLGEFTAKKEKSILEFMYDEKDLVTNG